MTSPSTLPTRRRLNIRGVEARTGFHRQTIRRRYTNDDFPKPHYLGANRVWWEDEVEHWEQLQMLIRSNAKSAGETEVLQEQAKAARAARRRAS